MQICIFYLPFVNVGKCLELNITEYKLDRFLEVKDQKPNKNRKQLSSKLKMLSLSFYKYIISKAWESILQDLEGQFDKMFRSALLIHVYSHQVRKLWNRL